jgi:hypothetical protein
MHTEHSPSNPEVQYEKTDAHPRPLYHFLFWICVTCIFSAAFSWATLSWLNVWREKASQPAVMAVPQDGAGSAQPPAPRLQTREPLDLAAFRKEEAEILSTYGTVDKEKGIFRIPIDEAMKLALERGFPVAGEATADAKAPLAKAPATTKPADHAKAGPK